MSTNIHHKARFVEVYIAAHMVSVEQIPEDTYLPESIAGRIPVQEMQNALYFANRAWDALEEVKCNKRNYDKYPELKHVFEIIKL
jgi:hypothetical protein